MKDRILELRLSGCSVKNICSQLNISNSKYSNIYKTFSSDELEQYNTITRIKDVKFTFTFKHIFNSKYFKQLGLTYDDMTQQQMEYLQYVLKYSTENIDSLPIKFHKIVKFLSRQMQYYSVEDDYYEAFHKYLNKDFANFHDIKFFILCYGKIQGELLHNERLSLCNGFANKTEDEIVEIKSKLSKSSKAYADSLTEDQKKSNSPTCKEFYIYQRNMSEEDAILAAKDFLDNFHDKHGFQKGESLPAEYQTTRIEYWLEKTDGNLEEAQKLLTERQTTFSLTKCIDRYGIENGTKIWQERQDKWLNSLLSNNHISILTDLEGYKKYYRTVYKITKNQNIMILDNCDKRSKIANTGYHLDHKYSIRQGFEDDIDPRIIGDIVNLEFLPFRENCSKGKGCSITKDELYDTYNLRKSLSTSEWVEEETEIYNIKTLLDNGYIIEIDSPDGWVDVSSFVDKGHWQGYKVSYDDTFLIVNENHLFETVNGWELTKDILGDVEILHSDNIYKKCYIKKLDTIHDIVDIQVDHENHRYYANGLSSHNTNVGKSSVKCHFASHYLTIGKNVLFITMEMAEKEIAKRIDANLLNVSMDDLASLDEQTYMKKVDRVTAKTVGKLVIKEFPTATAGVTHFRALLNELRLKKNFVPDVIFVDYMNICCSSRIKMGGSVNSYTYIKSIAEELRGLAVEYDVPIITSSQLNRCLDLYTVVNEISGDKFIKDVNVGDRLKSHNGYVEVTEVFPKEYVTCYKITTKSGKEIICSDNHIFPTANGEKTINSGLVIGDNLFSATH